MKKEKIEQMIDAKISGAFQCYFLNRDTGIGIVEDARIVLRQLMAHLDLTVTAQPAVKIVTKNYANQQEK